MASPRYLSAALIGVMAGARSQSVLAFVAWRGLDSRLATPLGRSVTTLSALGEVIGDKTPWVPNRTAAGPLAGRILFGGVGGAAVGRSEGAPMVLTALVGGVAAGLATFVLHRARRWLGRRTPLPDAALALAEDACVIGLALATHRSLSESRRGLAASIEGLDPAH